MTIQANGASFFVSQREGGRPALVLLHFYGGSHRSWDGVLDIIGDELHSHALDLRGFGSSAPAPAGYSVEAAAGDVGAVLAALEVDDYVLCGHSMGGKIALALAAQQPVGLRGLCLFAPSPPTPEPMSEDAREQLRQSFGSLERTEEILRGASGSPLPTDLFLRAVEDSLRADRNAWDEWLDIGTRENIAGDMERITVPALVVSGERDDNMTPELLQRELVARLPQARLEPIAGAGHLLPLEAPQECARLLCDFIGSLT